jgi:pSer/pThr/pTyr-binding forkhead associated (FHA) protein
MSVTRAFLEVVDGPGKGRRILLRDGQVRYVGRTSQADDCCPDNPTMSSVHFSVRWFAGKCELKDLNSANGTWRHGKKIVEALLDPGEEFKAGKSTFRLVADEGGETKAADTGLEQPRGDTDLNVETQPAAGFAPAFASPAGVLATGLAVSQAAAISPEAQLSDDGKSMLVEDMPVPQFVELLASREQYLDALRVIAHALAKRSAVQWACQCVRSAGAGDLSPRDEAALAAAEAWAAQPDEDRRRKAQGAAEAAEHKTAAAWAAMGAFWSDGSMGPATAPVVPPAPHLTGHAVAGAVMLAAVARQPEKASEKYQAFLQLGKEAMQSGKPPT